MSYLFTTNAFSKQLYSLLNKVFFINELQDKDQCIALPTSSIKIAETLLSQISCLSCCFSSPRMNGTRSNIGFEFLPARQYPNSSKRTWKWSILVIDTPAFKDFHCKLSAQLARSHQQGVSPHHISVKPWQCLALVCACFEAGFSLSNVSLTWCGGWSHFSWEALSLCKLCRTLSSLMW